MSGDLAPNSYTSSRVAFADDTAPTPREDSILDTLERPTEVERENSAAGGEGQKAKKKKASRTPSFFSRSYVAWKKVYDRGVYTPVRICSCYICMEGCYNRLVQSK